MAQNRRPLLAFLTSRQQRDALLVNAVLLVVCFFILLPIAATLLISFKQDADVVRKPPVIFPCDTPTAAFDLTACRWSVEGYLRVFLAQPSETSPLGFAINGRMLKIYLPNTMLYALGTSAAVVVLASMSGYAFSRFRFRGHNFLLNFILAITGVPLLTNLLGLYQMGAVLRSLPVPIYEDRIFIVTVYAGFFLPLSVWIAKGFFDAIPRELEEAALVDGCDRVGGFLRITLPLATPGLMAIFLLTFVNVWNEFLAGYLLITKNDLKPAMFGMYDFLGQNLINAELVAAACVIVALPTVVVFLLARETFFQAMVEGAVKG
ncbi:MAG: carbohydrate ABC transporter permease [Anaerolineales bacterium]|nr:carbohydrate ABC transporter permease [Anaerolineales bacterium]